ncbi:MAG: hypothetical protein B7Z23_04400 [Pseudomonadales bacterium 32-61-5]|nr:MAG: hypothetical protein B7Z23_04400 [Pseudomonadales bacterium 32-61-5]
MRRLLLASSSPYRRELLSRLRLPFEQAVRTGDSYYLVWPAGGDEPAALKRLREYLPRHLPEMSDQQVSLLD